MIVSPMYREEILFMSDSTGMKGLRDRYADSVRLVSVDTDAVLIDLDYPHEYEAALERWREESQNQ